jgi:hypothetical protein
VAPQSLAETKTVQNRTYHWCTKCNCGTGQWAITHTNSTHKDDYIHPNKHQDDTKRQGILKSTNIVRFQDQKDPGSQQDIGNTPSAQLSLQDSLKNLFRFNVQELDDKWFNKKTLFCPCDMCLCVLWHAACSLCAPLSNCSYILCPDRPSAPTCAVQVHQAPPVPIILSFAVYLCTPLHQ